MTIDKNIDFFLDKIEKDELVFRDGVLVRMLKRPDKAKHPFKRAGRITSKGYVQLTGRINGKPVQAVAHRVIWAHFYGRENLDPNLQINHINGIKDDNRIENLELVTQSENMRHAYQRGLNRPMIGEDNPDARLKESQVLMIKTLLDSGFQASEIAAQFGVTPTNIGHIRKGKTWSHVNRGSINRSE